MRTSVARGDSSRGRSLRSHVDWLLAARVRRRARPGGDLSAGGRTMLGRLRPKARRPITMEVDPSAPSSHVIDPVTGATLCERYRLDSAIARGASAVVWRATDLLLGEVV